MAFPGAGPFVITDKRQRTATFSRAKRSIDKVMISVSHGGIDGTQVQTQLISATFPCTVTGIRWNLAFTQSAGTGQSEATWAIVLVKEGQTADAMVRTNGVQFYNPEQNCLVFGTELIHNGLTHGITKKAEGTTKTMRKLMIGDDILFIFRGTTTDTAGVEGVIQFFCKV